MEKLRRDKPQKQPKSIRTRWMSNTISTFCVLGLVCVVLITGTFGAYYYSSMRQDLNAKAMQTSQFFANYIGQNYDDYYYSCVTYAQTFDMSGSLELQFINADGLLVASSYGALAGKSPATSEIIEAMQTRSIKTFAGRDPITGEQIIAVSGPMIYSNGEVVGVLRYVTSTRLVNRQIMFIGIIALCAFCVLLAVLLLTSGYFIRSILVPVDEIIEKAKMIANGSYGAQIQKQYNDEIGVLADTINEMSVQISQNEKTQTYFISSLSHELRTPLTAINGWSETLLDSEELDPETRRGVKIISREAKRLTEMVVNLLDFTRLQDDRLNLNMEMADIQAEFEDTVFMYGSRLAQDGIQLNYNESVEEIPMIPCDHSRLRQVFLNLLNNAAKHGGDGKRIDASMTCDGEWVVVQIRDYGHGIPMDELPRVKERFYKGSSKARGTGIGLPISDEIVKMHGGTLELTNAEGGGALVTVKLPVAQ